MMKKTMMKKTMMKRIWLCLIMCLCLISGCSGAGDNESHKSAKRGHAESVAGTAKEDKLETYEENITDKPDAKEEKRLIEEEESREDADWARGISTASIMINLITRKHMPVASDTVIYTGERMEYSAALTNDNDYEVNYTFMLMADAVPQPFMIEGESGEIFSAKYKLKPHEEKVIDISFKPVRAPYGSNALLSIVGISILEKPMESRLLRKMNVIGTAYCKYLRAESKECEIAGDEDKNAATAVTGMKKDDYDILTSSMALSHSELDENSIDSMRVDQTKLSLSDPFDFYFAQRSTENARCFILVDGLLANGFNNKAYIDIPGGKMMMYRAPVDRGIFKKGETHTAAFFRLDMDLVDEVTREGYDDSLDQNWIWCSEIFTVE